MGRSRKIAFVAAILGLVAARRMIQSPADVAGTTASEAPAPRESSAPRPKTPRVEAGNEPNLLGRVHDWLCIPLWYSSHKW